jgi:phosphate transport system permease protein
MAPGSVVSEKEPDIAVEKGRRRSRRYLANDLGIAILWLCGAFTLLILLIIIGYILLNGLSAISWDFLTQKPRNMGSEGGIYPTIVASVAITVIAILVATPLSVGAAIYMSEYAGENRMTTLVRFGADSLAGIPSIMFGMFGYIFFVYYMKMGYSILAGGLTLALMALPIILRVSEEAIKVVPESYRLGSMALGSTRWQTIRKVVLPTAVPGIITGIILGMGRAIGETAAVIFTAGTVAKIPDSLFDPVRTMTVHVFILAMENISKENAFGTSAVLVIMILAITIVSNVITRRYISKLSGRS